MTLADGRRVLLDRGFVPIAEKDAARATGPLTVEGTLAWPDETDGFTSDPDRAKNVWFARDVSLMAAALDTEPVMIVVDDERRGRRADAAAGRRSTSRTTTSSMRSPGSCWRWSGR